MYCAGKNFAARLLEERGLAVLDVDKLGHRAVEEEKDAILRRFGGDVLGSDGAVDRRALGRRVFGRPEELAALEAVVHPAANRLTEAWIAERAALGEKAVVINAAVLHRSSVFPRLDCIILVKAPFLTRLLRARKRDGLPWFALLRRFASQRGFTAQYLHGNADRYIVYNNGNSGLRRCAGRKLEEGIAAVLSREGIL